MKTTHPNGFEKVQVGEEVALGLVQPITGRLANDILSQAGHVAVGDVDELLEGRAVAEVPEMEAETFSQHLDGGERRRAEFMKSHHVRTNEGEGKRGEEQSCDTSPPIAEQGRGIPESQGLVRMKREGDGWNSSSSELTPQNGWTLQEGFEVERWRSDAWSSCTCMSDEPLPRRCKSHSLTPPVAELLTGTRVVSALGSMIHAVIPISVPLQPRPLHDCPCATSLHSLTWI
ncbi:hypothetical protein EYF80_025419 [Liparis tanakae]|uniref:Uncharacterized protein n=1 Tax=Liparis tanakae TaxID=230148 RepID=A0A4Z2HES8_9TELE|nr:hypothetical protein EYF80_025419 [Liparis tanakae]